MHTFVHGGLELVMDAFVGARLLGVQSPWWVAVMHVPTCPSWTSCWTLHRFVFGLSSSAPQSYTEPHSPSPARAPTGTQTHSDMQPHLQPHTAHTATHSPAQPHSHTQPHTRRPVPMGRSADNHITATHTIEHTATPAATRVPQVPQETTCDHRSPCLGLPFRCRGLFPQVEGCTGPSHQQRAGDRSREYPRGAAGSNLDTQRPPPPPPLQTPQSFRTRPSPM